MGEHYAETNLSSSQQSLFSLLLERKLVFSNGKAERLEEREYTSRFMKILLVFHCNISLLFALHSGHSQGWVWFYTEGFQCGAFLLKTKQKTCMQMCVFCRFGVWGVFNSS